MIWQNNPYAIPLLIGVVPVLGIALIAWRYRQRQAAAFFFICTLAAAGLMITCGLELLSATLPSMMVWLRFEYIFSLTIPVLYLLFVFALTGYESWLKPGRIAWFLIIPAIHLIAVWTNDYHHLNWQTVGTQTIQGIVLFDGTYGAMFWISTVYVYVIGVFASVILIVSMARYPTLYQRQVIPLILAITSVFAANILTITGVSFGPKLDLTPYGYAIVSVLFAWSLFRYKLFQIMPTAQRAIIKGMSDSVLVLDKQNRLIDLNPAAEHLIGHSASQAIGQSAETVFAKIPGLLAHYQATHDFPSEAAISIPVGQQHFDLRISPLSDNSGQVVGRVIVLRNITRLKQAEESARQYAAEIEGHNKELDAFSHTVAHDLQNPLSIIIGFADVLETSIGETLPAEERKYLQTIQTSAAKMTVIIDELLRLASLDDVGSALTEVDMSAVARAAVERLRLDIERTGVQIEIVPGMPLALGQSLWLEEVFTNLIGNAIKYMREDNPAPRITVRGFSQQGCVRYEIQDNGLGVNVEDQRKLFEAFTRFHKGKAMGSGLGLAIVARIVKRLNGEVGVESEPGNGSLFWFTLPAPRA